MNVQSKVSKYFFKKFFPKGFTLVETLISIMIVSIAFLGIYSAAAKYTQQTKQVKDTYVASLLGQEGIEIVRNIRDTNWVSAVSWDTGLTACGSCSGQTNGCQADYNDTLLSTYNNSSYLWINNGFYEYGSSGTITPYRRQICIDADGNILHVTVNIYWTGNRQTTIKEDLYNWKW